LATASGRLYQRVTGDRLQVEEGSHASSESWNAFADAMGKIMSASPRAV